MAGFALLGQSDALLQHSTHGVSFGYQLAAVAATVAIALAGGTLAGLLVSWVNPADQELTAAQLFDDGAYWTVRMTCREKDGVGKGCWREESRNQFTRKPWP